MVTTECIRVPRRGSLTAERVPWAGGLAVFPKAAFVRERRSFVAIQCLVLARNQLPTTFFGHGARADGSILFALHVDV